MTSAEFFARCAELTFQAEPDGFTNLDEDLYTWATEHTTGEPKPYVAVGVDRNGGVMPFMQWFADRDLAIECLATSAVVSADDFAGVLCDKTGPNWRFEIAEPGDEGEVEYRETDVDEAAAHLGL